MARFPEPIALPDSVLSARAERKQHLLRSISQGIAIRSAIIIAEFIGFFLFRSSSLFLDALASSFDVAASIALLLCIKWAEKPPDQNHPFGHGRSEPLAGLLLAFLMGCMGVFMVFHQVFQMSTETSTSVMDPRAWMIPFAAVILLEICYRCMMRAAKEHHSPALKADAVHYRIDAINSLFAMVALLSAAYIPSWSLLLDHAGAVFIAGLMVVLGIQTSRYNLNQLMDHVPDEQFFTLVRQAAKQVPGVLETEKMRIQLFGPDAHVSIDIEVDPELSVDVAHHISQQVRASIQQAWPAVRDVIVHIEPFYADDH